MPVRPHASKDIGLARVTPRSGIEERADSIGNLVTFAFAEAVARALNFGLLLVLPALVSAQIYGRVGLLVSIEVVASTVLMFGLDRAILRYFHEETSDAGFLFTLYVSVTCIVALLAAFSIGVLLCLPFKEIVGIQIRPTIVTTIAALPFLAVIGLNYAELRARNDPLSYAKIRIGYSAGKVLTVGAAVTYWKSAAAYPYALVAVSSALGVVAVVQSSKKWRRRYDWRVLVKSFAYSWPFAFHIVAGGSLMYADRFMVAGMIGTSTAGVYVLAYSCGACLVFVYSIASIYYEPMIYRSASPQERERSLRLFLAGMLGLGAVAAILIRACVEWGTRHVWGPRYGGAGLIVPVVLAAFVVHPIYLCGNWRLGWLKKTRILAAASFGTAVLNVAANFVLIPRLGLMGAAVASAISYWLLALVVYASSLWRGGYAGGRQIGPGLALVAVMPLVALFASSGALIADCALGIVAIGSALHVWSNRGVYGSVFSLSAREASEDFG